jgi:hypothetical protein
MTVRRVINGVLLLFILFLVAYRPQTAAGIVVGIWHLLHMLFNGLGTIADSVSKHA